MDEERPSPFADFVTGVLWIAASAAIVAGAWSMDRLERLSAQIYTAPGLVPGLLGVALALMGLILMARAVRGGALANVRIPRVRLADHWRIAVALALSLGFAIGLVGRGLAFWQAAALYIAPMVFVFEFPDRREDGTLLRGAGLALVFSIVMGLAIHTLFQDIFLVRLP